MIDRSNFDQLLLKLDFNFDKKKKLYTKKFPHTEGVLKVDYEDGELIYPEKQGLIVNERQTCNFMQKENFVVFECVHRLLEKGYKPEHIELEPKWKVGHGASGGRADILVKDNSGKSFLIIECKTEGKEHKKAWEEMIRSGGQLFSYAQQTGSTQYVCLYSSDLIDDKVVPYYNLVALKDNEMLLEEYKEEKPPTYRDADEVEDLYKAWKETYEHDYFTKGLFEEDIPAYEIGKKKFSAKDLSTVSHKDIQGKYHEFATILRQHNVSGRENAFDKLVNLFLCKIVDEEQNPEELKFYWKGRAYDTYFDLQDRLQQLYKIGMNKFLNEDVTYIDNAAIDEAFKFFKNDPDATRETIKKYFRELKFFTNNDFAFIDVHNEKLFYQNAVVMLKIVLMLQDLRLKTDEQNQFLGDMFEGFLDQGVKQSEGQFFTPMPIVKFILASLPLENLIKESEEVPQVIDYACGAGHFLNEYASQIRPYVAKHKEKKIEEYYPAVVGIEKEYRLSKVAKVSAFMYGQNDIQIIYNDALAENPKVKDGTYSLLVANPPYSVKGFLETIGAKDRKRYELTDTIDEKSYAANNSIEAFFIERAKQLLKPGGVAAIIVPSSILSKGSSRTTSKKQNVFVATREILLKYFDIVAIAEFGSGTFGKTGTNTVTLFLRRKEEDPAPADHFFNRVETWFKGDMTKEKVFEDEHLIKEYCRHLEYDFEDYKSLLKGKPNKNLLETELFQEYRKDFDKWSEIKNRKKQKSFKDLVKEEQEKEMDQKFLNYLRDIESDKLYHFVLAEQNPQEVVIMKTPTSNADKKKFLGYEWSSAKGNEGIKYLGGQTVNPEDLESSEDEEDTALDQDDVRVLSNLLNLENIQTPLYDPKDYHNPEKINRLITKAFRREEVNVPDELAEEVSTARLVDMIDFGRKDFNKAISLSPRKSVQIESKWELVKLAAVADVRSGGTPDTNNPAYWDGDINWATLVDVKNKYLHETKRKITDAGLKNSSADLLPADSILFSSRATIGEATIAKSPTATNQGFKNFICDPKKIHPEYLYEILKHFAEHIEALIPPGTKYKEISKTDLSNFAVPLPPLKVQKQIVAACEKVDKEVEKARGIHKKSEEVIKKLIDEVLIEAPQLKIDELVDINPLSIDPTTTPEKTFIYVDIDSVGKGTGAIAYTQEIIGRSAPSRARRLAPAKSTLISTVRPYLRGFAFIDQEVPNAVYSTGFAILKSKDNRVVDDKFLFFTFMHSSKLMSQMEAAMPKAAYPSINVSDLKNFHIGVPSIEKQKQILKTLSKEERKIAQAAEIIAAASGKKRDILKSFL